MVGGASTQREANSLKNKLFIFDCDGVLVDSEHIASEVFSRAVSDVGLTLSPREAEQRFRGRSLPDCVTVLEDLLGRPLPGHFLPDLRRATLEAFTGQLQPVDGVEAVLDYLRERGVPRCVASNGDAVKMQHSLRLTGLLHYFQMPSSASAPLFSAEQVPQGKPAPDLFLFAAERMSYLPSDCLVIEDSSAGIAAARAASMRVFAYAPGRESRPDEPMDPDPGVRRFGSMDDLLALLTEGRWT